MTERLRRRPRAAQANPLGLGGLFPTDDGPTDAVTVTHGPYAESLPVAGMTVQAVRERYRDRFDIDPRSQAILDGDPVGNDTVVAMGQTLSFITRAGEKGATPPMRTVCRQKSGAVQTVAIEGRQVTACSPEGQKASLSLPRIMELVSRPSLNVVLPDGVKCAICESGLTILVHQTPPRVHNLKWIAADSPSRFGRGTRYRNVRVALPYVVVFAVFVAHRGGRLQLSDVNECFFRNEPLCSFDDTLHYPALLNCSKFDPALSDMPLSWICTHYLDTRPLQRMADDNRRMRRGLQDLLGCLFHTGFNYSSEHHEFSSWFSESQGIDPRVSTIENWEAATRESPMFVLDIPWLPVGKSVGEVLARIAARLSNERLQLTSADDVARLVFNHGKSAIRSAT